MEPEEIYPMQLTLDLTILKAMFSSGTTVLS